MQKNKRMGRPTENPKTNRLEIRLSDSEKDMLEECARLTKKSKSDIVIEGVSMVYDKVKK